MQMNERRFWKRVGLNVTKGQAYEWVDKVEIGPPAGEYLVDDVESFTQVTRPSADMLRREIEDLFDTPAEDIEVIIDPLTVSILEAIEMEENKMTRLRELLKEGLSKVEAKEQYQKEMGILVADALDIDLDEYRDRQEESRLAGLGVDYSTLTVSELKSQLRERGLPVSGKKADLITRLQDA